MKRFASFYFSFAVLGALLAGCSSGPSVGKTPSESGVEGWEWDGIGLKTVTERIYQWIPNVNGAVSLSDDGSWFYDQEVPGSSAMIHIEEHSWSSHRFSFAGHGLGIWIQLPSGSKKGDRIQLRAVSRNLESTGMKRSRKPVTRMQDGEVVAFQGEKSGSAALQKMNRGEVTILERSEKSVRIRLKIKAALFQDGDKGKRKGSVDFKIDKVFDLEISKFAKAPKQDHWRR